MTKREIATLSFKVLSLYAFINAIEKLSTLIYNIYEYRLDEAEISIVIIYAAPMFLLLLCGGLLWFIAPFLASSISKSTTSEDNSAASLLDIQMVAFSVVGLYMIAASLPRVVRSTIWHFTTDSLSISKSSPLFGDIAGSLLEIVLGLWLLFGSRGLVNFITTMRRD